jgi:ankyrin repeat protein
MNRSILDDPSFRLYRAVLRGDLVEAQDLIEQGQSVQGKTSDGWNYLHKVLVSVLKSPPAEVISWLIANGIDPNEPDGQGWTPLHFAVRLAGRSKILEILLQNGANANVVNGDKQTPLMTLLYGCNPIDRTMIKTLLEYGADPYLGRANHRPIDFVHSIGHGENSDLPGILKNCEQDGAGQALSRNDNRSYNP